MKLPKNYKFIDAEARGLDYMKPVKVPENPINDLLEKKSTIENIYKAGLPVFQKLLVSVLVGLIIKLLKI